MLPDSIKKTFVYRVLKKAKIVDIVLLVLGLIRDISRLMYHVRNWIGDQYNNYIKPPVFTQETQKRIIVALARNRLIKNLGFKDSKKSLPNVIVSITSYPDKFEFLYIALQSVIQQTIHPQKIIVWLAPDEIDNFESIPKKLTKLQKKGVIFEWGNAKYRVYNKLLPALRTYPDYIIVTADDDTIYHPTWLESLYNEHLKYPYYVIGHKPVLIKKLEEKKLAPFDVYEINYLNRINETPTHNFFVGTPSHNILVEGVGGVLYPPHIFDSTVCDEKLFFSLCSNTDDIWYKAMALYNEVLHKSIASPSPRITIDTVFSNNQKVLSNINIIEYNDINLKKVFDYFNLYKYIDYYPTEKEMSRIKLLINERKDIRTKVPKILHRTLLWDTEIPENVKEFYLRFNAQNPDWKEMLWKEKDVIALCTQYNVLDIYNSYSKKIQKADFARYLIVYAYGGCYCDFDVSSDYTLTDICTTMKIIQNITFVTEICFTHAKHLTLFSKKEDAIKYREIKKENLIRRNDKNNLYNHEAPHRVANYFLMAKPFAPELWDIIELCKQRAHLEVTMDSDILYTTGPDIVSSFYHTLIKKKKEQSVNMLHQKYITHHITASWRTDVLTN